MAYGAQFKSQSISNISTSGPLDWELNEDGFHIFLDLFEGGEKGWILQTRTATGSSSQEDSSILETAAFI